MTPTPEMTECIRLAGVEARQVLRWVDGAEGADDLCERIGATRLHRERLQHLHWVLLCEQGEGMACGECYPCEHRAALGDTLLEPPMPWAGWSKQCMVAGLEALRGL